MYHYAKTSLICCCIFSAKGKEYHAYLMQQGVWSSVFLTNNSFAFRISDLGVLHLHCQLRKRQGLLPLFADVIIVFIQNDAIKTVSGS